MLPGAAPPQRWAGRTASCIATWFGCGLVPRAPGTVGSIGALPVHGLLREAPAGWHLLAVVIAAGVGTWAAQRYATDRGQTDPQSVVIDEVAGTLIALGLVRDQPLGHQLAALVAFRVLDIWKPGPIRRLEHARPVGFGIMLDDLLAGLCAGALVWCVAWFLA